jgi:metal-dependent amidase/aminoacylase/carboxypeptidase family protein
MAFNFDSGQPDRLIVAATGAVRLQIEIMGIASHAGVHPEDGVSAITIASLAISRLHRDGLIGRIEKGRRGTSNVGRLSGGEASNVVAPRAQISAEVFDRPWSIASAMLSSARPGRFAMRPAALAACSSGRNMATNRSASDLVSPPSQRPAKRLPASSATSRCWRPSTAGSTPTA